MEFHHAQIHDGGMFQSETLLWIFVEKDDFSFWLEQYFQNCFCFSQAFDSQNEFRDFRLLKSTDMDFVPVNCRPYKT